MTQAPEHPTAEQAEQNPALESLSQESEAGKEEAEAAPSALPEGQAENGQAAQKAEGNQEASRRAGRRRSRRRRHRRKAEATKSNTQEASAQEGAPSGSNGEASSSLEGSPSEQGAQEAQEAKEKEGRSRDGRRSERSFPYIRFFPDGVPFKSPFAVGEVVGGLVIQVNDGVAKVDLFDRGIAFVWANESRKVPGWSRGEEEARAEAKDDGQVELREGAESTPGEGAGEKRLPESPESSGEENEAQQASSSPLPSQAEASQEPESEHGEQPKEDAIEEGEPQQEDAAAVEEAPPLRVGEVFRGKIAAIAESGHIALANRSISKSKARARLLQARRGAKPVDGFVFGFNRGGFDVLVEGLRAFCSSSDIAMEAVEDPHPLLGSRFEFLVQEVSSGSHGIVVSRRLLERRRRIEALWKELEIGKRVKGRVTQIWDTGMLVDLGGIDAVVLAPDISWARNVKPADVYKVGDEVEGIVLELGKGQRKNRGGKRGERVRLSIKACLPDPWEHVASRFKEGQVIKGRVSRTAEFGAFVELMEGVEALLPLSELGKDIKHASERLSEGEEVEVIIERIDLKNRRIGLSRLTDSDRRILEELAQKGQEPLSGEALRVGAHVRARVEKIDYSGVYVQIDRVIGRKGRAYIPNSEMGTERGTDHRKKFPPGTMLDVKIIGMERDGSLRLSRRAYLEDEERRAVYEYRKEAASKGLGTLADLLRSRLQQKQGS
ncbi:MAG: S1 RNA-binding domain-containing protein [Sandaracinaceae bacterium]|nr:S1 RNA-binding domain-containing protein [Sandaracinaceae bacterium]